MSWKRSEGINGVSLAHGHRVFGVVLRIGVKPWLTFCPFSFFPPIFYPFSFILLFHFCCFSFNFVFSPFSFSTCPPLVGKFQPLCHSIPLSWNCNDQLFHFSLKHHPIELSGVLLLLSTFFIRGTSFLLSFPLPFPFSYFRPDVHSFLSFRLVFVCSCWCFSIPTWVMARFLPHSFTAPVMLIEASIVGRKESLPWPHSFP